MGATLSHCPTRRPCRSRDGILQIVGRSNAHLGDWGVWEVVSSLRHKKDICLLSLPRNSISDVGAQRLAAALVGSRVHTLNLSVNSIGSEGAVDLATSIATNSSLTSLDLYHNNIGSKGLFCLAEALEDGSPLVALNLGANPLVDPTDLSGMERFCSMLKHKRCALQSFEFTRNFLLNDNICALLGNALAANKSLKSLVLKDCSLSPGGVKFIADGLQANYTLDILDLRSNRFGDTGTSYLATMLQHNERLKDLNLGRNHMTDIGLKCLGIALEANASLTALNLECYLSTFSVAAIESFECCLKHNSQLYRLQLHVGDISPKQLAAKQLALIRIQSDLARKVPSIVLMVHGLRRGKDGCVVVCTTLGGTERCFAVDPADMASAFYEDVAQRADHLGKDLRLVMMDGSLLQTYGTSALVDALPALS